MALRTSGTVLQIQGLSSYVSGLNSAAQANKAFAQSLDGLDKGVNLGGKDPFGNFVSGADRATRSVQNIGRGDPFGGLASSADRATGAIQVSFTRLNSFVAGFFASLGSLAARTAVDIGKNFVGSIGTSLNDAGDFQQDIANAFATFDIPPEQLGRIKAQIASIAVDPKLVAGFNDVTSSAGTLAQKGISLNDILGGALRSTVLLQNVAGGGFDTAATVAARTQTIFGISADKLSQNVGQVAGTIKAAGLSSLEDYNLALSQGAGALAGYGVSFLDFNTLLGSVGKNFSGGSDTATSLKTFVSRLVPTTQEAQDALDKYNISFVNTDGSLKSFDEISGILANTLHGQIAVTNDASGSYLQQQAQIKSVTSTYNSLTTQILKYKNGISGAGLTEAQRSKKLAELNVQQANAKATLASLAANQEKLGTTTRALTEEERIQFVTEVFGRDSSRVALGLAQQGAEGYLAVQKQIAGTDASAIAARRTQTLRAALKTFGDTLQATGILAASPLLAPLEKGFRALTSIIALGTPALSRIGEGVANFITPSIDILAKFAEQINTIGTAGGDFKLDLGGIKALSLGDLFTFDIFGLSGYFNDQIGNINLDLGRLHFGFTTTPDLTDIQLNFGELLKSRFSSSGGKTALNINDYITFTNSSAATTFNVGELLKFGTSDGRTVLSFDDYFRFDATKSKTNLNINDYITVAKNNVNGEIDLKIGTFKTAFDAAGLDAAIQPIFTFVSGFQSRVSAAFAVLSNAGSLPDGSTQSLGAVITAKITAIPTAISTAFTGLTFPDLPGIIKAKFDALFSGGFTLNLPTGLDTLSTTLTSLSGAIGLADNSLKLAVAPGGSFTQVQTFVESFAGNLSTTLSGIDPSKTLALGGAISVTFTSITDALTDLSKLGNASLGTEITSITDLLKGTLDFVTGTAKGLDGDKIGASAGGFVSSLIDKFTVALGKPDLAGLSGAASGFVLAISGQFKSALSSNGTTEIGASLGSFVTTLVGQLGTVLSNPKVGDDLGKGFANIIIGITQGASNLLNGAAKSLDGKTSVIDTVNNSIGTFTKNFISGVAAGLRSADYGAIAIALIQGVGASVKALAGLSDAQLAEKQKQADAEREKATTAVNKATQTQKEVAAQGTPATPEQKKEIRAATGEAFLASLNADQKQQSANFSNFLGFVTDIFTQGKLPGITAPVSPNAPVAALTQPGLLERVELGILGLVAPFIESRANQSAAAKGQLNALGAPLLTVGPVVTLAPESTAAIGTATAAANQQTYGPPANLAPNFGQTFPTPTGAPLTPQQPLVSAPVGNAADLSTSLDALNAGASAAAATITQGATGAATSLTTGANTFASSITPFPGWGTIIGPPIDLSTYVPTLNWADFIQPVGVPVPSNNILGFATGTPYVPKTGAYLVGEKGPEVVTLQQGSGVIPNHKIGGILGAYADGTPSIPVPTNLINNGRAFIDQTIANATIKVPVQPVVDPGAVATAVAAGGTPAVPVQPTWNALDGAALGKTDVEVNPIVPAGVTVKGPGGGLIPISASLIQVAGFKGTPNGFQSLGTGTGASPEQSAAIAAVEQLNAINAFKKATQGFAESLRDLEGDLKGIVGLNGPSPITAEQVVTANAGGKVSAPDDFVRQLGAFVLNGDKRFEGLVGQAQQALSRVGVTASGDTKALLEQVKSEFYSGHLFSNTANLPLINADAVKEQIKTKQETAQGSSNVQNYLLSLIGGASAAQIAGLQTGGAGGRRGAAVNPYAALGIGPLSEGATLPDGTTGIGADGVAGGGAIPASRGIPAFPGWTGPTGIIPAFPVWRGDTGVVPTFPAWVGSTKAVIPPFPGWVELFSQTNKATATTAAATTTVNSVGGAVPIAGARAGGGPVAGGSSYLVGEDGPEVFTPTAAGTISPNSAIFSGTAAGVASAFTGFKPGALNWEDVIQSPNWRDVIKQPDINSKVPRLNWTDVVSSTAVVSVINSAAGNSATSVTQRNPFGSVGGSVPIGSTGGFEGAGVIPIFLPHRALGGPVAPGQSYIVGENGQELFTPRSAGYISSNNDTARLLSNPPSTNNYNTTNITKHLNLHLTSSANPADVIDQFGVLERYAV